MIQEVVTSKGAAAITSDRWHVVHSRCVVSADTTAFTRGINSEHADRNECKTAAHQLRERLATLESAVPAEQRDEVFIRPPGFKSLKATRTRRPKVRSCK
ncbi:MAG: hypothetical protein IPK26_21120 [Planctomycetes bacterium]|nr:hypothetical protein [Planctomycetota bacterium]